MAIGTTKDNGAMTNRTRNFTRVMMLVISMTFASAAHAGFFVRPYLTYGGEVIDGLEANGATEATQSFTSDLQTTVDLSSGTVKSYLNLSGTGSNGQATGIFGDSLTFYGGEGTTADFSFDFDGIIRSPASDPSLNSLQQIGVYANLFVFDSATGATYNNFTSLGGALIAQSLFLDFSDPETALDEFVSRTLSGSVAITGIQTLDVFASLSIFASLNDNPVNIEMDFMNTGTFGVDVAPGVAVTSESGVFLADTLTPPVPEPATWAMMIVGFGLVGSAMRRRQSAMSVRYI
ncbi:PEPxxWA-CTERM sorting domain-containing protein [Sphingobium boeckii]|nr:PEPxxWA-CTERM sorting domain-containing protein [Sphingobium boeckii]